MRALPEWARRRRAADAPLAPDDPLARELRALYAAPGDGYWDEFEARIVAAVRSGAAAARRGEPVALEWWQALARWSRPGLAAAAVLLGLVGAAHVQGRASRSVAAAPRALGRPSTAPFPAAGLPVESLDPEIARVLDLLSGDSALPPEARAEKEARELLQPGVEKRRPLHPGRGLVEPAPAPARVTPDPDAERRVRREATFRFVLPD